MQAETAFRQREDLLDLASESLSTRGAWEPGTRLTFETVGPARLREGYMIPARDGHQPRLVLDLEKITQAEFRQLVAAKAGHGDAGEIGSNEIGSTTPLTMSSIVASAMALLSLPRPLVRSSRDTSLSLAAYSRRDSASTVVPALCAALLRASA